MRLGIDFGTTNSAVAVLDGGDRPHIVELAPGERTQRSVVHCGLDGNVTYGNAAFRNYLKADLQGRFLRSLKAFLPQAVPRTRLGRRDLEFTQIIAFYLQFLVQAAEEVLGDRVTEVVVGRPVVFHAKPARHEHGLRQLHRAIDQAELRRYTLRMEPVAAARRYEQGLSRETLVLVGDFGGGTADFAVLRAGPDRVRLPSREQDVLGTSGVAMAGDAMDSRFMQAFLLDLFGRGLRWRDPDTRRMESWTPAVLRKAVRLYYVHMLRDPVTAASFDKMLPLVSDRRALERLRRLIFEDLGYPLAWAIEGTKQRFSDHAHTVFRFEEFYDPNLDFEREVDREGFAAACATILSRYGAAIDDALAQAGVRDVDIDDIFLTGGTSQLPFVHQLFADRFGSERLRSADALTSVCEGLVV